MKQLEWSFPRAGDGFTAHFVVVGVALLSCTSTRDVALDRSQPREAPILGPLDAGARPPIARTTDSGQPLPAEQSDQYFEDPAARDTRDLPLEIDFLPADCPPLDIDLAIVDAEYTSDRGVLVKLLQYPEFHELNRATSDDLIQAPQTWDSGEFPSGACILRIRGILASCYAHSRSRLGTVPTEFNSYYFHQAQSRTTCPWPSPGCPRAHWGAGSIQSYWWYLTQRDDDVLFVACSDLCNRSFPRTGSQLLRLTPPSDESMACSPDGGS